MELQEQAVAANVRTRTHSYFAVMGGFGLDTSETSIHVLDESRKRGTLEIAALEIIADKMHEVLSDIPT